MADLAASAVTPTARYKVGDKGSKYKYDEIRATLVLTGQGSTTNKIPASAFYLDEFYDCSAVVTDSNTIYPAVVSYDGSAILIADAANATATNHVNGLDLTDTVKITVRGRKQSV